MKTFKELLKEAVKITKSEQRLIDLATRYNNKTSVGHGVDRYGKNYGGRDIKAAESLVKKGIFKEIKGGMDLKRNTMVHGSSRGESGSRNFELIKKS